MTGRGGMAGIGPSEPQDGVSLRDPEKSRPALAGRGRRHWPWGRGGSRLRADPASAALRRRGLVPAEGSSLAAAVLGSGASGLGSCSEVARFPPLVASSELVEELEKVNGGCLLETVFPEVTGLPGVFPSPFVPGISPKQPWLASHLPEGYTSSFRGGPSHRYVG